MNEDRTIMEYSIMLFSCAACAAAIWSGENAGTRTAAVIDVPTHLSRGLCSGVCSSSISCSFNVPQLQWLDNSKFYVCCMLETCTECKSWSQSMVGAQIVVSTRHELNELTCANRKATERPHALYATERDKS
jgi:hypothetical protein